MPDARRPPSAIRTFAAIIRAQRRQLGLELKQIADDLGVSAASVSLWEHGRRRPREDKAVRLADLLKLEGNDRSSYFRSLNYASRTPDEVVSRIAAALEDERTPELLREQLGRRLQDTLDDWAALKTGRIRLGIVPVAGWWARIISPATTARMVQLALDEGVRCGIREFVIVVAQGPQESLSTLLATPPGVSIAYAVQREYGLAWAVRSAQPHVKNAPFALIFPDEIVSRNCLKDMIDIWERVKSSVVALRRLTRGEEPRHYGMASVTDDRLGYRITALSEKPAAAAATPLAVVGRYVLTPDIFAALDGTPVNPRSGLRELTDAMQRLADDHALFGYLHEDRVCGISPTREQIDRIVRERLREVAHRAR